jgi:hypothetical protein
VLDHAAYCSASAAAASTSFEAAQLLAHLLLPPSDRTAEQLHAIAAHLCASRYCKHMPMTHLEPLAAQLCVVPCLRGALVHAPGEQLSSTMTVWEGEVRLREYLAQDWSQDNGVATVGPGELIAARGAGGRAAVTGHFAVCTQDSIILYVPQVRTTGASCCLTLIRNLLAHSCIHTCDTVLLSSDV